MIRYILMLTLVILLAGCSVNEATGPQACFNKQGCSLSQEKYAKNLDKYNMHRFNENLEQWKETAFWRIRNLDLVAQTLVVPEAPDALWLRTIVSDEQLDAFHQPYLIGYENAREQLRNYIPESRIYDCRDGE